ncbi:hypothetical protein ADJ77_11590 [Prevotella fusca JCM 17724]|uniref:Uncharacterized protein n=1 Tax=Prevotella fusca JCM 17724 TaxID=1236517 RepID=A0A0K1NMU2_9BACT|nr:hypothetical protein ADJ77_11590 [Prevotella fusca JCM 17724]
MIFQTIVRIFKVLKRKGFLWGRMIIKQVAKTVLAMLLFNFGSSAKAVRKVSTHLTDEQKKVVRNACTT